MNQQTFAGERVRSDTITNELASKNGEIFKAYRDIVSSIIDKDNTDPIVRANSQGNLSKLNSYIFNNVLKGPRDIITEEYTLSILNVLKKMKKNIDADSRQAAVG